MADPERGERRPEALTLEQVAALVGGRIAGPPGPLVHGVAAVDEAGPDQMGLLSIKRYVRFVESSRAGSFLVARDLEQALPEGAPRVVVTQPNRALSLLLEHFHRASPGDPTIHPTAVLGRGVLLGARVRIDPYAVLEDHVSVGDGARIGAHCVLGAGTAVGEGCTLHPHVVVYPGSVLGSRVVLHAGVRVGSDGFGYTPVDGVNVKVPQVGRAIIADDVEVGANTTIDRGSLGDTVVGEGVKIDNLVQIAHNVKVGAASLVAALVGIAGSTRIGRGAWLGGRASAINHLEIGDGARVTFGSTVTRDVPARETVSGYPARPHREELRRQAQLARLGKLFERLRRVEEAMPDPPRASGGVTGAASD